MKASSSLFLLLIVSLSSLNCAAQDGLKGLREYLRQVKYETFVPPRQNVIVSTIVNYDAGYETIVSSKCVPPDRVRPSDPAPIGLTNREGHLSKSFGLEAGFAKAIDPRVDVTGAYKDSRVQSVSIEIADPSETHIETNDLKDYIASLKDGSSCLRALTNKRNRILGWLLHVNGVKYTFVDKDGKNIRLDASLLNAIKLSPQYQKDFQNKDAFEITKPIVIGYRAWQVIKIPGAAQPRIDIAESTPEDIQLLKKHQ